MSTGRLILKPICNMLFPLLLGEGTTFNIFWKTHYEKGCQTNVVEATRVPVGVYIYQPVDNRFYPFYRRSDDRIPGIFLCRL